MSYRAAKISFDGSHYIATPKENFPQGNKRRRATIPPTPKEVEQKEQFDRCRKIVDATLHPRLQENLTKLRNEIV